MTATKLDDLTTPDDNTDLDATTSYHGLLPKLGGGTTNFLRADGTWVAPAGGGDVVGPASAVDDRIATFNLTTGKLIQDSGSTVADVLSRTNHTGTQTASTISDFDTEVANNSAVSANTSKVTNVPTSLSVGTVTTTTVAITSDGGADDVVLPAATVAAAGMLTTAKWAEIVANNAKVSNVSTSLSVGTVGIDTVAITSDGGVDDVTLPAATISAAGMLTTAKWGEIVANNAKITNASHTGDVTGSGALTIAADAVTYAKMQNVTATSRILGRVTAGAGIVEELTAANVLTIIGVESGAEVNNISDVNATDLTDAGDSTLHYHASDRARANHTGSQLASTISDFVTQVTATKLDDFATPDDNTDLNATITYHGLLPKLGGGTTNYLRADGTWAAPAGSGLTGTGTDNRVALWSGTSSLDASAVTDVELGYVSGVTSSIQTQLNALSGSLVPQGAWNASTNTPTLPGSASTGQYWIVSVAGTTDLGGITDWEINDWAVKTATGWAKIDNTDKVLTVAGRTGAVVIVAGDLADFVTTVQAVKLDDMATPDDNTDLNATTSYHGLLPKLGGGTTNFLRADGSWSTPVGAGDVVGPASAVDDRIATFDLTTGKLLQDGGSTIADVLARANHTGTQLASTISDFDTEVGNNSAVALNTAKLTNVPTALSVGTVTTTTVAITSDGGADDVVLPAATVSAAGMLTTAKWAEIVANNAKVTNVSTTLSAGTVTATTYGITSDGGVDDIVLPEATTDAAGLLGADKWDEIVANSAKVSNVSTSLSVGTVGANTVAITSDGGIDDVTLPAATVSTAGMLTTAKWGEIVANNAKVSNVSTSLSVGTVGTNTVAITSDGGADDVTLPAATVSTAGMFTTAKWSEVVANNAKVTNATHTGDVTGATALTIGANKVTLAMMADMATASFLGRNTAATGDPEVLSAATAMLILAGTALDMEDAVLTRPKLKDYSETVNAIGSIGGGTQDIDLTLGNVVTGTVDTSTTTFTFSNPPASGSAGSFTLILTNGGSQTVNWPASVDWAGGTAPSLTAAGRDILTFTTVDAGTIWYGFAAGLAMA